MTCWAFGFWRQLQPQFQFGKPNAFILGRKFPAPLEFSPPLPLFSTLSHAGHKSQAPLWQLQLCAGVRVFGAIWFPFPLPFQHTIPSTLPTPHLCSVPCSIKRLLFSWPLKLHFCPENSPTFLNKFIIPVRSWKLWQGSSRCLGANPWD